MVGSLALLPAGRRRRRGAEIDLCHLDLAQVGEVAAPKEPYPDWETVPVEAQ